MEKLHLFLNQLLWGNFSQVFCQGQARTNHLKQWAAAHTMVGLSPPRPPVIMAVQQVGLDRRNNDGPSLFDL